MGNAKSTELPLAPPQHHRPTPKQVQSARAAIQQRDMRIAALKSQAEDIKALMRAEKETYDTAMGSRISADERETVKNTFHANYRALQPRLWKLNARIAGMEKTNKTKRRQLAKERKATAAAIPATSPTLTLFTEDELNELDRVFAEDAPVPAPTTFTFTDEDIQRFDRIFGNITTATTTYDPTSSSPGRT